MRKTFLKYSGEKKTVSIRLPVELVDFYQMYSSRFGQNFSYVIRDALDQVIEGISSDEEVSTYLRDVMKLHSHANYEAPEMTKCVIKG